MPNGIDKSLLDRLAALRGGPSSSQPPLDSTTISVDTIKRKKTPTREESLVDRLKSLRDNSSQHAATTATATSKHTQKGDPTIESGTVKSGSVEEKRWSEKSQPQRPETRSNSNEKSDRHQAETHRVDEDLFATDDQELEDLLRDVPGDDGSTAIATEPSDAQVRALLENLAASVPQETLSPSPKRQSDNEASGKPSLQEADERNKSDDSDDEGMKREVDDVIARFRDEMEMERRRDSNAATSDDEQDTEDGSDEGQQRDAQGGPPAAAVSLGDLPSVPSLTADGPASTFSSATHNNTSIDSLTSRLSALRTSTHPSLPSVPSTAPMPGGPRLTSTTNYTDDDVSRWCTVCLEDATLTCLGCEDDPYCARCWKDMHLGPSAGYEERGHKAVEFGKRRRKKKVAVGA